MVRVRYRPQADRVATFEVLLIDEVEWKIGYVTQTDTGSWSARRRGDVQSQAVGGWPRRSDAATWLALAGEFARQRPVPAPALLVAA
jgi:hypothetical protein